jgi:hypothetical protein
MGNAALEVDMQHLDEGTIHAWLDGALAPNEASEAEAHVQSCAQCANAVAEARGLVAASSRILAALDDVPAVQQPYTIPLAPRRRTWWRRAGVGYAAAATALLAVGTTLVLQRMSPNAAFDEAMAAREAPITVQPDVTVLESIVPPPTARSAERAANEAAGVQAFSASSRAKNAKASEPKKEELSTDKIVPLPGPMPRPAAPRTQPPAVRQEPEQKLADAVAGVRERGAVVQGRVLDAATGAPVAGAQVRIDSAQVQTDSAGRFKVQPAPLGQQTISIQKLGFQPAQQQVAVAPRDSMTLGFTLQKSAAELSSVVTTGAAAAADPQRSRAGIRDSLLAARRSDRPVLRLEEVRANTANLLGCYTLRPTNETARDADRAVFAIPTRIELEGRAQSREHREEQIVNRARKLEGPGNVESWRFVGDSLELTFVDGTRRLSVRFARDGARWLSLTTLMEPCLTR